MNRIVIWWLIMAWDADDDSHVIFWNSLWCGDDNYDGNLCWCLRWCRILMMMLLIMYFWREKNMTISKATVNKPMIKYQFLLSLSLSFSLIWRRVGISVTERKHHVREITNENDFSLFLFVWMRNFWTDAWFKPKWWLNECLMKFHKRDSCLGFVKRWR